MCYGARQAQKVVDRSSQVCHVIILLVLTCRYQDLACQCVQIFLRLPHTPARAQNAVILAVYIIDDERTGHTAHLRPDVVGVLHCQALTGEDDFGNHRFSSADVTHQMTAARDDVTGCVACYHWGVCGWIFNKAQTLKFISFL